MELPIPIPAYALISSVKIGDMATAFCDILGCTVQGKVTRPIGVNEFELLANGKKYCLNPANIVSVARSDKNAHTVKDKPPKEPKPKKGQ